MKLQCVVIPGNIVSAVGYLNEQGLTDVVCLQNDLTRTIAVVRVADSPRDPHTSLLETV